MQIRDLCLQNEGKYSDSYQSATYAYQSSTYLDDLAFAVRPRPWLGGQPWMLMGRQPTMLLGTSIE